MTSLKGGRDPSEQHDGGNKYGRYLIRALDVTAVAVILIFGEIRRIIYHLNE